MAMTARTKLDAREIAFTLDDLGFDVVLEQAGQVTAFRGALSVAMVAITEASARTWAATASSGDWFTVTESVDGLIDWAIALLERRPAEPAAFFDGERVFRLDPVAAAVAA